VRFSASHTFELFQAAAEFGEFLVFTREGAVYGFGLIVHAVGPAAAGLDEAGLTVQAGRLGVEAAGHFLEAGEQLAFQAFLHVCDELEHGSAEAIFQACEGGGEVLPGGGALIVGHLVLYFLPVLAGADFHFRIAGGAVRGAVFVFGLPRVFLDALYTAGLR
jgi:hypothetical protein